MIACLADVVRWSNDTNRSLTARLFRLPAVWLTVVIAAVLLGLPSASYASFPQLLLITPGGVQRGQTHTLTFHGRRLDDTEEVFFYSDGIQANAIKSIGAGNIEVTVEVAADCRLGEHVAQVRTRSGISDYRIVYIEACGSVEEVEPNDRQDSAQLIEPAAYDPTLPKATGIVVGGSIRDEDHDWFAVDGTQGDRLSIEVIGMRLGAYCDATLQLFGPQGRLLAEMDDTPLTQQDPFISVQLPADGRYLIRLADASGRGSDSCRYRLHVGNFPRPKLAIPSVVANEGISSVAFVGDAYGPIDREEAFHASDVFQNQIHVVDQRGSTPSPLPLWRTKHPIVEEVEPNENQKQWDESKQSPLAIPVAAYGQIGSSGDLDTFCVQASKGQVLRIETFGRRAGSPIDTMLRIHNDAGRQLAQNTDTNSVDSQLRFVVPADGQYYLQVSDEQRDFGPMFRYYLSVVNIEPSFELGIKSLARYEQRRQSVAVHAGNRFALSVTVKRDEFDGPIRLVADELPAGIRMLARTIPAGVTEWPVVFEAAELPAVKEADALGTKDSAEDERPTLAGVLIPLVGVSAADDGEESGDGREHAVTGHFVNQAQMMRIQPNNMTFHRCEVERVAAAVLEPAPFKIELVPPAGPLAQNGLLSLQVNITRQEGHKHPITLSVPYRSPGVGARATLTVNPNQSSVSYPINANGKANTGTWPICLSATVVNRGEVMVSTALHTLEIIEPFVAVAAPLVTVAAGGNVAVECSVEQLNPFTGNATVKLVGLPPGASAEALAFKSTDEKITLMVNVKANCPLGKHQAVACQVTVMQGDHPIVFNAGLVPLRVTAATRVVAESPTAVSVPAKEGT